MSVLWNDENWFFEKRQDQVNKIKSFMCVRKLYISNIHINQWGSNADLCKYFEEYGVIEEIENYPEKYRDNSEDDADKHYAYVTFADSMSAYRALMGTKYMNQEDRYYRSHGRDIVNKKEFEIIPADTYKQPDYKPFHSLIDDDVSLKVLNEDCLLEIFKYLNLQSLINLTKINKRIATIMHNHIFPKYKSIVLDFSDESASSAYTKDLATIRNYVTSIGTHVHTATLKFRLNGLILPHRPHIVRIIDVFTKHIGENIEHLEICNIHIDQRALIQFKPIFARLTTLKWSSDYKSHHEIDLVNNCPNLRKLSLYLTMDLNINQARWAKLESVAFSDKISHQLSDMMFFKNNRNLRCLKLQLGIYLHFIDSLLDKCSYLQQLEKLTLSDCINLCAEHIQLVGQLLLQLPKLKELQLWNLSDFVYNSLNESVQVLSKMHQLESLKIGVEKEEIIKTFQRPMCPFPAMATKLQNLKRISIMNYQRLTENSIIEFVKNASSLEDYGFSNCELSLNRRIIEGICDVRRKSGKILILNVDPFEDIEIDAFLRELTVSRLLKVNKIKPKKN